MALVVPVEKPFSRRLAAVVVGQFCSRHCLAGQSHHLVGILAIGQRLVGILKSPTIATRMMKHAQSVPSWSRSAACAGRR